jgi:phosphatidylglycerol:prolipoprotein diacylglycerol transferase
VSRLADEERHMMQVLWRIPIHIQNWFPDGIPIYGFGMMLFLAFILCTWMAGRRAQAAGVPREYIQDMTIYLFIGGLIGARVLYLIGEADPPPASLLEFLRQLPRIWDGGIILYGSVLGGLVGYLASWWFIFRKYKVPTLKVADIVAPTIAVGLCLGRIGCFLNGCCYGQVACPDCLVTPVHFPLSSPARYALVNAGLDTAAGFTFAPPSQQPGAAEGAGARIGAVDPTSDAAAHGLKARQIIREIDGSDVIRPDDVTAALGYGDKRTLGQNQVSLTVAGVGEPIVCRPRTVGLYPTQLYETTSMFLLLLVLLAYQPFRTRDGQLMALLMVGYGIHRFLNEMLRSDPRPVGFERYTSVLLVAAGLLLALYLRTRPAQYQPRWSA